MFSAWGVKYVFPYPSNSLQQLTASATCNYISFICHLLMLSTYEESNLYLLISAISSNWIRGHFIHLLILIHLFVSVHGEPNVHFLIPGTPAKRRLYTTVYFILFICHLLMFTTWGVECAVCTVVLSLWNYFIKTECIFRHTSVTPNSPIDRILFLIWNWASEGFVL